VTTLVQWQQLSKFDVQYFHYKLKVEETGVIIGNILSGAAL
jgi:hypothetical protein